MKKIPANLNKPENPTGHPPELHFYHATLVQLEGKPLFARGSLPTIHTSLTYAVWYIYWMSKLELKLTRPSFFIYELREAERYLMAHGNGLYSVNDIGSIPYDDRNAGILKEAPQLFQTRWEWEGKLTYIPARCLERVRAEVIREQVDLQEWLELCGNLDDNHPLRGLLPAPITGPLSIPASWRGPGRGRPEP